MDAVGPWAPGVDVADWADELAASIGVGGSGAGINQSSTTVAGGDGSDGVVIVTEYSMGVAG